MKLETLFEKFDLFADAPDTVAKMRELILESALRGNLVSQDAKDEPASHLVRRLEIQSSTLGSKQQVLPPVGDDAYFKIPTGWAWTRLGNTGRIFNGDSVSEIGKAELANVEEGLPFIATKDVGYGRHSLVYDNGLKVPIGDRRFKVAKANAVLICAEGGSAGRKIGLCDRDICFGNKLYANEVREDLYYRFIFYVYQAPTFFREFTARMTGIIGGIARSEFLTLPIPIPPLAEQKRIVATVDELLALCDRLEAQQQDRETRHAALTRASLARFSDAPTSTNLDLLFHKSYSISPADLRKSILTLAVQGKLVPQDLNAVSAAELLELIAKQRARLLGSDSLRKTKSCRQFTSDETPHDIPETWTWTMLGEITEIGTGSTPSRTEASFWVGGTIPWITSGSTARSPILDGDEFVTPEAVKAHRLRVYSPGTLLVALYGQGKTRGQVAVLNIHATVNQACAAVCALQGLPPMQDYLRLVLEKQYDEMRSLSAGGAQPNLNVQKIKELFVPLPPLGEQRRIVAKVDELMALVDTLETRFATAHNTGSQLLDAVVAELTRGRALA